MLSFLQYITESEKQELSDRQIAKRFAHPERDESGTITGWTFKLVRGKDVADREIHSHLIDREGNRVETNTGEGYNLLGLRVGKVVRRAAAQAGHTLGKPGQQLLQYGTPVKDTDEVHITIPVRTATPGTTDVNRGRAITEHWNYLLPV
jgi:hypothetical protein